MSSRVAMMPRYFVIFAVFVLMLSSRCLALEPREIALITNRNVPQSAELARYYAQARQVPETNIIELELPEGEQIPFDQYEPMLARPLRDALQQRGLQNHVKCLVTFYGVPLRIETREASPQTRLEANELQSELQRLQRFGRIPPRASSQPATTQPIEVSEVPQLTRRQHEYDARRRLREWARQNGDPQTYARVLQEQLALISPEHSDSAVDNELALLWLAEGYPRGGWQVNPMGYPYLGRQNLPRTIMVMRLDAPTSDLVEEIIDTSIAVEQKGLSGTVVVDSRSIQARKPDGSPDAFGVFDERLRELARLIETSTKLKMLHDENPAVLPPASVEDVALYCGWYSVGIYVPAMKFVPGAVGYHVASFELTTLRDETNNGWGRGLIKDGVVATLGPVAEPLLHAFPAPDDFMPLLLTGKLPLAEVYWRTCPLTSWKMCMIGDPLYTPFKNNPALAIEQLPDRLKVVFSDDPSARPGR